MTDDSIIATGYYRLGIWDDEPADPLQARYDDWDDIISTTSQVMLGLTVGCARCHDHKIDPIPQADYYGLLAFFADVTPYGDARRRGRRNSQWDMSTPEERRSGAHAARKATEIEREKMTPWKKSASSGCRPAISDAARRPSASKCSTRSSSSISMPRSGSCTERRSKRLEAARDEDSTSLPAPESALALAQCEAASRADAHHAARQSARAGRRGRAALSRSCSATRRRRFQPLPTDARSAGRRRVLAEWIASPRNMLTARVIVNRVWQHHFGRGIVRSANNFGELGTPPTHPELLDWLALWLVDHNWQLKPLHRLIMTSNAYRMSSAGEREGAGASIRRTICSGGSTCGGSSAEEIRDATLVATGRVQSEDVSARASIPKLSQEVLATQSRPGDGWGESSPEEAARRSVYIHVKRSLLTPLLTAFDFPDVDASCEARFVTTQPGQALAHAQRRVRSTSRPASWPSA